MEIEKFHSNRTLTTEHVPGLVLLGNEPVYGFDVLKPNARTDFHTTMTSHSC